jgi:hypothetical protein
MAKNFIIYPEDWSSAQKWHEFIEEVAPDLKRDDFGDVEFVDITATGALINIGHDSGLVDIEIDYSEEDEQSG